jgi:hypothetical protein
MGDDSTLRDRVAKAFLQQFPGIQSDKTHPDMVVFFTIVDYVPGCLPNCKKFRTYRNWSCEVEIFPVDLVFNLDGATYNPFHDPVANCAAQLTRTFRR